MNGIYRENTDSMYSSKNLKIEEKGIPPEDFDDEGNRQFLHEVYRLIKVISPVFTESE